MNRFLPLVMTPDWSQMPFFWNTYDDCSFFISRFSGAVPPPASEPPLGTADAAMIACLEEHFAEINAEIDASVAHARNTPPPPPPDPESRKFWRVFCDAGIDTDSDGSPDWAEFEISDTGQGVLESGVRGDAFDADTNGDGIPDGLQLDVDLDGTADAADVGLDDPAASYPIGRLPRYALFEIMNATPPADYPDPLQINDRGEVLYANGVWQAGVWTPLAGHTENSGNVRAIGINDHGEILGIAGGAFTDQNGTTSEDWDKAWNVVHWPDRDSWCAPVIQDGKGAWMGTPYFTYPGDPGNYLSNDGSIIAMSRYLADDHLLVSENYFLWTLAGPGRTAGRTATPLTEGSVLDRDTCWGGEYVEEADGSTTLVARIRVGDVTLDPPGSIHNVIPDGAGGHIVSFSYDQPAMALRDGEWMASPLLAPAIDVDSGGTAIGRNHGKLTAPILLNGRWTDISRCAPDLADAWKSPQVNHRDTTPEGWILCCDDNPATQETSHAVMLPFRLEPPAEQDLLRIYWDGVDAISVGSKIPTAPVQDALWLMAPLDGGETRCLLKAPLCTDTPLILSGANLRFNDGAEVVLTSTDNSFTVAPATGGTIESGTETDVNLHLGGIESASKPIKVKFMKHRTVKVNLYHVPLGDDVPDFAFHEVGIDALLTNTFLPKLNLDFDVRPVVTLPGGWDADGDGAMDAYPEDGVHPEQQSTLDSRPEEAPGSNIDIFLMSGNRFMVNGSKHGDVPAEGVTNRTLRCCWINAETLANPQVPGSGRPESDAMLTLIHEVGHIFTGYGHPDQEEGVSPLKGTDRTLRLMHSGDKGRGGRLGTMLVKEEWDEAETWLRQEEANQRL